MKLSPSHSYFVVYRGKKLEVLIVNQLDKRNRRLSNLVGAPKITFKLFACLLVTFFSLLTL